MTLGLANSMSNSSVSRSLEKNTLEECSNYPISDLKGAGVYISSGGTFTKTGGTINGYTGDKEKDNVVTDSSGKALQGKGHAIYFDGIEPKAIDTTVGQEMNISFSSGVFKDNSSQP